MIAAVKGFCTRAKNQPTLRYSLKVATAPEFTKAYPMDNVTLRSKTVLKLILTTFSQLAQPIPGNVITTAPIKAGTLGCNPYSGGLIQRPTINSNMIKHRHSCLFIEP